MKTKNLLVLIIVMALFGGTPSAWAIWNGASSGTTYAAGNERDYDLPGNWVSSAIDDSFSGFLLTGDLTVTLDLVRTTVAGGLNLNYDGNYNLTLVGVTSSRILMLGGPVSADTVVGGKTITIGGGAGVSLSLGTVARTFTVGAGDTLVIANATANTTGGITKEGTGILQLNAANAYTGTTTVNGGELKWGIANALSSGNLTINNGGTVNIQSFSDTVGTVTIAQGGSITGTAGVLTPAGGLVANDGGTISGFDAGKGLSLPDWGAITYNSTGPGSTTLAVDRITMVDHAAYFNIANGDAAVDFEITSSVGYGGGNIGHYIYKSGAGVMQFSGTETGAGGQNGLYFGINDGTALLNKADGVLFIPGNYGITIGDSTGSAGSALLKHTAAGGNNQISNPAITINSDGLFDLNGKTETTSGALTVNSTGQLQLNNGQLTVGTLTLNPSAGNTTSLSLGSTDTLTLGGDVTFTAAGTGRAQITGSALSLGGVNRTFNIGLGTGADYDLLVGAGISASGARSLTKNGLGRLVLTGSNSYTGGTTVNLGTLQIGDGTTAGTMASTGALTLGGGTFAVRGPASGGSSQTVASLATTAGTVSTIRLTPGASDNTLLTITSNTPTTGAGSSVNFDYTAGTTVGGTVGNNYVVWSPTLTAGIIGGAYTVTDSGGTGFATTSGGNVVRLTDPGSAGLPVSGGSATGSYFVGSDYSMDSTTTPGSLVEALSGAVAASNVKVDTTGLTSGANLALGENLMTLGAGMVISGPNPYEITGSGAGGLKAASAGGTIYLNNASSGIVTISGPIVNNTASRLTVDGPGTTILSGVNTYTGATIVNGGAVRFSGTMAASPITINNGTAQLGTATGLTSANTVTFGAGSTGSLQLLGNSGTIGALNSNATLGAPVIANNAVANATLTIDSGSASSFGGVIQDGTGGGTLALAKSGAGTLTLSGSNTYSGGTVLNAGKIAFGANNDTYLGATSGGLTINGGEITYSDDFTLNANRTVTVNGPWPLTNRILVNGVLSGNGSISQSGSDTATFANTGNTFTGTINSGYAMNFASLGDSSNPYNFGNSTGSFTWTGVAKTFAIRPFTFYTTGSGQIRSSGSGALVIQQDLAITGTAGNRTLELGGTYTGPGNTFAGSITNGAGSTVSLTKGADASMWALSGTNTYTGATTLPVVAATTAASGAFIFQGIHALSPNTSLSATSSASNGGKVPGTFKILDDSASPESRSGVNLFWSGANGQDPFTIFVGNNNTANGGTSAGTTIGSTIQLGNMSFTQTAGSTAGLILAVTGANGYQLRINNVSVSVPSYAGAWNTKLSSTTAPLIVAGNVQQVAGGTGTVNLQLDGTATGNLISGNILNSADGTPRVLSLTKAGLGDWTLSGNNTYSGGTTITAGKLQFNGANALPASGTVAVGASVHFSLADGTARNQTVSALTLASLASLYFDWTGSGTGDQLTSTANITPTANSRFYVNLNRSGTPGGPLTLLTGGGGSTLSSSTFYLANATNYTATLATPAVNTLVVDNYAAATPLTTFYWQGNKLAAATVAGVDNAWALSSGTNSNWSSSNPAYTATALTPGSTADVIFANNQTGKTQQSTVLGADVTVNSVTIDDSVAVTIAAGANNAVLSLLSTLSTPGLVDGTPGSAITVAANAANPTISSRVNLGANQTWNVASGKTLTVSGDVVGDFSLTKADAGTVILSGANTYSGNTTISAGTLRIGNNTAGTLGAGSYAGNIVNNGTLQIWSTANQTLSGVISGSGNLQKAYGGTLTLAGNNTYTGQTLLQPQTTAGFSIIVSSFNSVNGGTPLMASSSLGAPTSVANGTIELGSGSAQAGVTLTYTGTGETTDRVINFAMNGNGATKTLDASGSGLLKFTSTFTKTGSNSNDITLQGSGDGEIVGGLNFVFRNFTKAGNGTWTVGGNLGHTGTTTINGGILTLSGNNTYTGTTTVSGGRLVLSGEKSIADTGTLNIAGGKVEVVTKEKVTVLQYSGTTQPIGTYGSTASAADNKMDTYFSGTGVLYVGVEFPPAGTLILFM